MRFVVIILGVLLALATVGDIRSSLTPAEAQTLGVPPTNHGSNCSGTIASGNAAQALTGLPTVLHGIQIQNLSTDILGFSELTTNVTVGSPQTWQLAASGGSYNSPTSYAPKQPIYIIGATTGDSYSCVGW